MKKIYKHIIAAVLALSFAFLFYINTSQLKQSAAKLPRILIALIVVLSIGMVIEVYWKSTKNFIEKRRIDEKAEEDEEQDEATSEIDYKKAFIFAATIALYIFLLKPVGYFIITPIFIIGIYKYLKTTTLLNSIIIAAGFTIFVYVLFVVFLKIPIPLGLMK